MKELQNRKEELQTAISGAVSNLVETFKKDTGMSPDSIYIDMLLVHDAGFDAEYVVGETEVHIEK